ncbi:MAG TPA: HD domain-containing protein [Desulfomonilaceae bacterium]|nr:HD domain-containing protein [Desulfomonilaceae bacterium]
MGITLDPSIKHILSIINELAPVSYLVGGAIRDTLMDRPQRADLDVAVKGDGLDLAKRVADRMSGIASVVPLDAKRFTGRIVLRSDEHATVDISALKGDTIHDDLCRRDFTINSIGIALNDFIESGLERLIDPCEGKADLRNKVVRACSRDAFQDDPLRILRGFRFVADLGFQISPDTLVLIPASLPLLRHMAHERVRDELIALLAADASFAALRGMDAWGVLETLFPELGPMKGCGQNEYHHLDVWDHSLETVRCLEEQVILRFSCFDGLIQEIEQYMAGEPVKGRPRIALLKLAAIFHDAGKPQTRFVDSTGRVRFFGHERVSEEIFSRVGVRLKLAVREMAVVRDWISGHMRPMFLNEEIVSRRALHRLYRKFHRDIFGLLLLHLADLAASRGPARSLAAEEKACNSVSKALEICLELEKSPLVPLLNGKDLMGMLGLKPGPQLGRILNHLAELQAAGDIKTTEEAVAAAGEFLNNNHEN